MYVGARYVGLKNYCKPRHYVISLVAEGKLALCDHVNLGSCLVTFPLSWVASGIGAHKCCVISKITRNILICVD